MKFNHEKIPEAVQKALAKMGFQNPTPIQKLAIPVAFEGKDIVGRAQTGSGKTAAFSIPLVSECVLDLKKRALILAPTRELAAQIKKVVDQLCAFDQKVRSTLLVGGARTSRQLDSLKKRPSIIIATPGRLNDHLRRQPKLLSHFGFLVLDEADRMLDMGFGPQIEEILEKLPEERQSFFFSATFPKKFEALTKKYLKDPKFLEVPMEEHLRPKIREKHLLIEDSRKEAELLDILLNTEGKTLVFTRTKRGADRLHRFLKQSDVNSVCIHGDRTQWQREKAIAAFRKGEPSIMVATDVAGRGLDIDQVKLVVNFDLPENSDDYTHRIGRTGRNGEEGVALSLVRKEELNHWKYLQNPNEGKQMKRNRKGSKRSFSKKRTFRNGKKGQKAYAFKNRSRSAA